MQQKHVNKNKNKEHVVLTFCRDHLKCLIYEFTGQKITQTS
jgi:hypothetical protein